MYQPYQNNTSQSRCQNVGRGCALIGGAMISVLSFSVTHADQVIDPIAQQAYVKASNTEANDRFGRFVAASGDTVVVAAYEEASSATSVNGDQADNSAVGSGAAYVFVRSGN